MTFGHFGLEPPGRLPGGALSAEERSGQRYTSGSYMHTHDERSPGVDEAAQGERTDLEASSTM